MTDVGGPRPVDIGLRPATEADVVFLTDCVVLTAYAQGRLPEDFDEADYRAGFGEWTLEQVRGEIPDSVTSVIVVDGEDAGRFRVVRTDGEIELAGLQLLQPWQGRGVGTHFLDLLKAEATVAGVPLVLGVEKDNPRARRFYEREGFTWYADDDRDHRLRWSPVEGPTA